MQSPPLDAPNPYRNCGDDYVDQCITYIYDQLDSCGFRIYDVPDTNVDHSINDPRLRRLLIARQQPNIAFVLGILGFDSILQAYHLRPNEHKPPQSEVSNGREFYSRSVAV